MARRKILEEPKVQGAPEWIVTFTDMVSLLVTFFVLLMTFSSIEEFERLRVDGWLTGTRGNLKQIGGHIARETLDHDIVASTDIRRGANLPHTRPFEHLEENLEEMGQTKAEDELEYDFKAIGDGLQIAFDPECGFAPGSTEVNDALRASLEQLSDVLQYYPHLVVVEGFTDGGFKPTPEHPSAESLSLARALAAIDVMTGSSDLLPELLQAAGLGSTRPRGDDETLEGRLRNRRVEVRVIALSGARVQTLEAEDREVR